MAKVYIKLPKTGLGNMLLVWAKGVVFAYQNNLPVVVSSWWGIRPGVWLRAENKKRIYAGYFNESPIISRIIYGNYKFLFKYSSNSSLINLSIDEKQSNKVYVFDELITSTDLFSYIRNYKNLISKEIVELLTDNTRHKINDYKVPDIALHIRRGDFKIAQQTTPLIFFINVVNQIRNILEIDLAVTVFTDADKNELEPLLKLPNVLIAESKPDILDILLMSKSKILVLSKSSTFSYWGAFLSEALIVRPHSDWQKKIRDNSTEACGYTEILYNDELDESVRLLKKSLLSRKEFII